MPAVTDRGEGGGGGGREGGRESLRILDDDDKGRQPFQTRGCKRLLQFHASSSPSLGDDPRFYLEIDAELIG